MTQARTVEELKAGLAASRRRLLAAIEGVTEEQCKRRVSEGEWCIAEVLAHLMAEHLVGDPIAVSLKIGGPVIPISREVAQKAAKAGRSAVLPQLVHGLLSARRELERVIDEAAAAPGGLERAVAHPSLGQKTVRWLIEEYVINHELEHVAQIEELRKGLGAAQPESWSLQATDRPARGSA